MIFENNFVNVPALFHPISGRPCANDGHAVTYDGHVATYDGNAKANDSTTNVCLDGLPAANDVYTTPGFE